GQQGRLFIDLVDQGIQQPERPGREAERLQALNQRGVVLEQELRRLILAYASIESGALWTDLAHLNGRQLAARYDSLRRQKPKALQLISEDLALGDLVSDVQQASRRVAGMGELVALFALSEQNSTWVDSVEKAAHALSGHRLPFAGAAYRNGAMHLVRLKRAEENLRFETLAYAPNYGDLAWLPATILEALEVLHSDISRYGANMMPPLVTATVDYYDGLRWLRDEIQQGKGEKLSTRIAELASNRAVSFDPANYANHVDRARVVALSSLLAGGKESQDLPDHLFPSGDRESSLSFLNLLDCQPTADEWREIAHHSAQPFFARWAESQAVAANQATTRLAAAFDALYVRLQQTTENLRRRAALGQDWSSVALDLARQVKEARIRYRGQFFGEPDYQDRLTRLDSLATALSRPLLLSPTSVTVRLGPSQLNTSAEVVVEFAGPDGQVLQKSSPISLGPSAPAGTGWVGTSSLALAVPCRLGHPLQVVVRRAADNRSVCEVAYGAIGEEVIPGALTRPQPGFRPGSRVLTADAAAGSVHFKLPDSFWKQLELPHLR
ncbi:MAG: hypothetical protein ABIF77_11125, partial [bacterium]